MGMAAVIQVNSISNSLGTINDVNSVKQRYAINFRGSVHDRAISIRDVGLVETDAERRAAIDEITRLQQAGGAVRETADGFQVFMLGAFAIALLLSVVLGAWTEIAIRPPRDTTDIMRRLADGDLSVEIPASSDRHEVGDILRSLDTFKSAVVEKQQIVAQQAERDQRAA
jgi:methyl-accepting chemotaxis protein